MGKCLFMRKGETHSVPTSLVLFTLNDDGKLVEVTSTPTNEVEPESEEV